MSYCSSPFVASSIFYSTSYEYDFDVTGSYTLPAYSIPGTECCLLGYNPPHTANCHWTGWDGWELSCQWVGGSWYWYDCWTSPSIPIWPAITFNASATVPLLVAVAEGTQITYSTPTTPYESSSVAIKDFTITLAVTGGGVSETINLTIPTNVTVQEDSNGSFATNVTLAGFSSAFDESGYNVKIAMTANAVLCLNPSPPLTWLDIQLVTNITVELDGATIYSTNFTITCPLVPQ